MPENWWIGFWKAAFEKIQHIQCLIQPHVRHCLWLPPFLFIQKRFQGMVCSFNDCMTCGRAGNAECMSDTPLFQKLVKHLPCICCLFLFPEAPLMIETLVKCVNRHVVQFLLHVMMWKLLLKTYKRKCGYFWAFQKKNILWHQLATVGDSAILSDWLLLWMLVAAQVDSLGKH